MGRLWIKLFGSQIICRRMGLGSIGVATAGVLGKLSLGPCNEDKVQSRVWWGDVWMDVEVEVDWGSSVHQIR
jgi:hypothetical protein